MSLSNAEKKRFRAISHSLKPSVIIAQKGLTENVAQEIHRALEAHELIKIKLQVPDREKRRAMIEEICVTHQAESAHSIGHVVLLYRAAERPDPKLSNLIRKVT